MRTKLSIVCNEDLLPVLDEYALRQGHKMPGTGKPNRSSWILAVLDKEMRRIDEEAKKEAPNRQSVKPEASLRGNGRRRS